MLSSFLPLAAEASFWTTLLERWTGPLLGLIGMGILETFYMTFLSAILAYVLGLPMGILLVVTAADGIKPMRRVYRIIDIITNIGRSVPFLILLITIIPLTRLLVGTIIGSTAAIPSLVLSGAPFIARLVESSLREVDHGVVEAAQSMGASNWKIIWSVLLPESKSSLAVGATIGTTTIMAYSAMAGVVGGGGLGAIANNYGYVRYQNDIMLVTVVLMVVIVQVIQMVGMRLAKKLNKVR